MNVVQSESAERPLSLEGTSNGVFRRTEINESTKEQEDGTIIPWFTYTETYYTLLEWREVQQDDFNMEIDFRTTLLELGV